VTSLRFLRAAREEYRVAREWYESQRSGLGREFRDAVEEAIERIRSDPGSSAIVWPPALRQTLVHRFPYAIYYVVEADEVLVVSVFHSRRNPRVWKRRLP
jgi:plasmid stabilization system protein ParE